MKKNYKIHKMDDWERYRWDLYGRIIQRIQTGDFDSRRIAYRVYENKSGVFETPKTYNDDGVAYNDGDWLIFNTSRTYKQNDTVVYKDKVFCKDKSQVITDLYSYILFLRKVGIDVVYEMNYYAVAFLVKYLRFYDKVFDCTPENQKKIGELCQAVNKKKPEEIDCESRKDTRQFAFDPEMTHKMTPSEIIKWQNKIEKQITDEQIKKWYDPKPSLRDNLKILKEHGVKIRSVGRLHQWVKEYIKG